MAFKHWLALCALGWAAGAGALPVVPDTSLAGTGYALAPFRGGDDRTSASVADASGRVYLVGRAGGAGRYDSAIARLTPSGQLDSSYASGGMLTLQASAGSNEASAVALDSSGRLLLAGAASDRDGPLAYVARLNPNGTPDASFGSAGVRRLRASDFGPGVNNLQFSAIAVGSINGNGYRIFAGGTSINGNGKLLATLVALDESGAPVSSYANGGMARLDPPASPATSIRGLYYGEGFEIYAVGRLGRADGSDFLITGWRSDTGELATRLGNPTAPPAQRGYVSVNFGAGTTSEARSIVYEARGNRYLVGGYTDVGGDFDLAISKHVFFSSGCDALYPGTVNAGCLDSTFGSVTVGNPPGTRVIDLGSSLDLGGVLGFAWEPIPNSSNFQETHYYLSGELAPSAGFTQERTGVVKLGRDGQLDLSFGSAGIGRYAVGSGATVPFAITQSPYLAPPVPLTLAVSATGSNGLGELAALRLSDTGVPDASFGNAGSRLIDVGELGSRGRALVRQNDGKLLVAGEARIETGRVVAVLARYLSDGALDPAFGSGGRVLLPLGSGDSRLQAVSSSLAAIHAVGESVVNGTRRSTVVRLNLAGALDAGFGSGGVASFDLGEEHGGEDLVLDSNGRLLIVGTRGSDSGRQGFIARLTANGALDTGFGVGGVANFGGDSGASASGRRIALSGSQIYAAGTDGLSPARFLALRWDANGVPDASFGSAGRAAHPAISGNARLNALLVGSDGKLFLGGGYGNPVRPALLRLSANGSFDFNADLLSEAYSEVLALSFDTPTRVLAAGISRPSGNPPAFRELTLWRVFANGINDLQFADLGRKVYSIGLERDSSADAVLIDPAQRIVVAGDALDTLALARLVARASSSAALFTGNNPSSYGQALSYSVQVSGGVEGDGAPVTGTVELRNGATLVDTGTLNGAGVATLNVPLLPVGSNVLQASYLGDAIYAPATTNTLTQTVTQANTSATLVPLSPATVPVGTPVNVRVDVTAQFGTTVTGQISLRDGGVEILRPTLFNGSVTLSLTNFAAGVHTLTAVYLGDGNHLPSPSSNALTQTISSTVATLSLSATPPIAGPTRPLSLRLQLSGGFGTPTGTVSFRADGQLIAGCAGLPISAGVALCTTSFATPGGYLISAEYSGDATYVAGSAGPLTVVVSDPVYASGFE